MKWETENNFEQIEFFSQIIIFSWKCLPLFPFIFNFYPSQPFQMGPGKIRETTNQLSLGHKWRKGADIRFLLGARVEDNLKKKSLFLIIVQ